MSAVQGSHLTGAQGVLGGSAAVMPSAPILEAMLLTDASAFLAGRNAVEGTYKPKRSAMLLKIHQEHAKPGLLQAILGAQLPFLCNSNSNRCVTIIVYSNAVCQRSIPL